MSCPMVLRLFQEMGNPEVIVLFTEILVFFKKRKLSIYRNVLMHTKVENVVSYSTALASFISELLPLLASISWVILK